MSARRNPKSDELLKLLKFVAKYFIFLSKTGMYLQTNAKKKIAFYRLHPVSQSPHGIFFPLSKYSGKLRSPQNTVA